MRITGPSLPIERALFAVLPKTAAFIVAEETKPTIGPAMTQPATSVQMLVALAAAIPDIDRRRKLAASTEKGLDALERLHREIQIGSSKAETLREIADWSTSIAATGDIEIASILKEVELRVLVELAKHDVQI